MYQARLGLKRSKPEPSLKKADGLLPGHQPKPETEKDAAEVSEKEAEFAGKLSAFKSHVNGEGERTHEREFKLKAFREHRDGRHNR